MLVMLVLPISVALLLVLLHALEVVPLAILIWGLGFVWVLLLAQVVGGLRQPDGGMAPLVLREALRDR
jgi:hypothetical protein